MALSVTLAIGLAGFGGLAGLGCAGVKPNATPTGGGGTGGTTVPKPGLPGLTGLTVSPPSMTITLVNGSAPGTLTGTGSYTASGSFMDGTSSDVTTMVNWSVSPNSGAGISNGVVTVSAPGGYTITASSGSVLGTATLTAGFSGQFTCTDFGAANCTPVGSATETTLDGSPSGTTAIAYPIDGALFPSNLGPIQVQTTTGGTAARINFQTTSGTVNVNFYGMCEAGPGSGCYVTVPVAFTQLMIPSSEGENIHLTARVSNGGAPAESAPISAAWASSGLTGGLYFWTVEPGQTYCTTLNVAQPPNYCLLDNPSNPPNTATAIYRYDFAKDNPAPQLVWTDDGGPNSTPTPYLGAPQAWDNGTPGGHCIGCHSITNDGKYMALGVGGSSTHNGANWELLDIAGQALELINPPPGTDTSGDPNATVSNNSTEYWKGYRKESFGSETAWNPDSTAMVNMFMAKLYQSSITITGTSATATHTGPAVPTYQGNVDPYGSDPFWSHDGSLFVFTSFSQAAPADPTNNPSGLNGDLKTGGAIAIATATNAAVNDDAKVLVSRGSGLTNYYPSISEDSAYVVFNQSTCGTDPDPVGGGYGTGTCDGYDDSSAKLWWIPTSGGATTLLNNANGGSANYDNSWPRFSPDVGTFRGNNLYWVAFSSRRPYGVQVNNTTTISATQPQLWFTGVSTQEINIGDPSFAPVWLPGQNPKQASPYGNHVPQWVKVAIPIDTGI